MLGKLMLVIAVGCLIQASLSLQDDSAISEARSKIASSRQNVVAHLIESRKKVANIRREVSSWVDEAVSSVQKNLKELQDAVEEAKQNANGKDLSACEEAEQSGEKSVDLDDVSDCKESASLNLAVNRKFFGMKILLKRLDILITRCLKLQSSNFGECVDNELHEVGQKSEMLVQELDGSLENAKHAINACIQSSSQKNNQLIEEVASDFNECVNDA